MNFSFDPALIARARQLILHSPNLSVLLPEHQGRYSALVVEIERQFKKREAEGVLLLPDLSALSNSTIGIFFGLQRRGFRKVRHLFILGVRVGLAPSLSSRDGESPDNIRSWDQRD